MNPVLEIAELFPTIQGEGVLTGEPSIFVRTQGCSFGCNFCDTKYSWKRVVPMGVHHEGSHGYTPKELAATVEVMANEHNCRALVLTGGEPFEQDHDLLAQFLTNVRKFFKHITIETAAFVPLKEITAAIFGLVDVLSISPKLPRFLRDAEVNTSEQAYYTTVRNYICKFELVRRHTSQLGLKFVITPNPDVGAAINEVDWIVDWLQQQLTDNGMDLNNVVLTLQPNGYCGDGTPKSTKDMLEDIRWLVEYCIIGTHSNPVPVDSHWSSLRQQGLDIRILPQLHRLVWGVRMGV